MADQLLTLLRSSKLVFWEERRGVPEPEIQKHWDEYYAFLTQELAANRAGIIGQSSVPQKRAVPGAHSLGGLRPPKRRGVVGFALLD